jgi:carboxypeptidase Q
MPGRRSPLVSVLLVAFSAFAFSSNLDELRHDTDSLAGSIYTGPSMSTLRELTDGIGGRLTGSPAYNRAADWAAAKFRSYGLQNVHLEPFSMPNGWQRGSASGQIVTPIARPLHIESLGWSPSTPSGGVKGEVFVVTDIHTDKLKAQASQMKGKIVFIDATKAFAGGFAKVFAFIKPAWEVWKEAGVLGVLYPDRESNNVLNAHDLGWGGDLSLLPGAEIGLEDSKLIRRLLEQGSVTVSFTLDNRTSGPMQVNNVIAEIRGSELPNEWLLVGAHLDSWDFGTGAQDNGAGTASVLEVARAIASMGKKPRRTIRFALWGGEEQGLLGSYAYAKTHADDLKSCIAVLNTDNGSGHPKGWKVEGRKDLEAALQPISDNLLKDISGGGISQETTFDTDHGPFMLYGVPALDLWVDMNPYMEVHHKSSDTVDKVDPLDFKAGSAILAVTTYVIAQNPQPIAPHIDHAAVGEILKKAELDELLQAVGVWQP